MGNTILRIWLLEVAFFCGIMRSPVKKEEEKTVSYLAVYQGLTRSLSPKKRQLIVAANAFITRLMYLSYPIFLAYVGLIKKTGIVSYVLIPALGFLFVTLLRKFLKKPRPYEAWPIHPILKKETKGQSMPSRHVFSATIIAMCLLSLSLVLGSIFLALSILLACCRVLGGVHYPTDVAVGYGLAVVFGLLFFL